MANGIEDLMNIRTMGGTQNVPPRPPMNPMQGGLASMGGTKPTMPPVVEEQRAMPPMGGQEMPSERPQEPVSAEQDGAALAQAVVGRANGDIGTAIDILDNAKAMLMQSGQEEPMMMADGGELNPGLQALQRTNPEVVDKILKREMGGPLYAEDGMPLTDAETMKQMIMNSLRENPVLNSEGAYNITSPMGTNVRTAVSQLSNDVLGRDVSDNRTTSGRGLSDKDLQNYMNMNSDKSTQEAANAAIAYQMSLR
jgi:hypothetical protein|tara:strand:+ start:2938 stop:3696 length:759 start_codon:yes stop_codon:yes gene_type:complete